MGRAFNDQLETGKFTTNSDDADADKIKDIENEAFTWALNLYFLMTDLIPELVSSGVNSDHFHLMANHALFGFGIMSSNIASDSASKLENLLSTYNFARVQVAPDGDYLFSSVIFQLKQMVSSGNVELHNHLEAIGFHAVLQGEHNTAVSCLRSLMVSELLENRATYDGYITNNGVEYEEQVENFKQIGVYSGEIGNVMVLSLTNVLRMNMVLFTSMENFPLISISPLKKVCTHQTLTIWAVGAMIQL